MNEFCYMCNEETNVPKARPISERRYYVEAAGQLCRRCFYDSYRPRTTPEDLASRALSDIQTHDVFKNKWSKE